MTKEALIKGNQIVDRLKLTEAFLDAIKLKDHTSPIILQAGMAKPIQFDVQPQNRGEVQELDAKMYDMIVSLVKEYKKKLENIFENLS